MKSPAWLLCIWLLAGCGGGTSTAEKGEPATASFSPQKDYKRLVASGLSLQFTISGTCTGTGQVVASPATTATTFDGAAAVSAMTTTTVIFSDCVQGLTGANTATSSAYAFFDTAYNQLGMLAGSYGIFEKPFALPERVAVGDSGTLPSAFFYLDTSMMVSTGSIDYSYTIEPDTATTAILILTSKTYTSTGTLALTEQDRYQMDATGVLQPVSMRFDFPNGNVAIFTYLAD